MAGFFGALRGTTRSMAFVVSIRFLAFFGLEAETGQELVEVVSPAGGGPGIGVLLLNCKGVPPALPERQ